MNRDVIITCAVTGAADTVDKHPNIPVTPQQIAGAAIEAAMAGAVAHRDNAFKILLAKQAIVRALATVTAQR